jgi:predicted MPP superfamily phosphohydrolase
MLRAIMGPRPLTLLHLSDLHFGHGADASTRFDQRMVTAQIVADVGRLAERLGPPDFVLITGDVAFSGEKAPYEQAGRWINGLLDRLGIQARQVLVVPGNHDVDRKRAREKLARRTLHEALRKQPSKLDECIADAEDMSVLWPKLEAFSAFASAFGTPRLSAEAPFWKVEHSTPVGPVAFVGVNTALTSFDNEDSNRNLALGNGQLDKLFGSSEPDTLRIVLQHHPTGWLSDGSKLKAMLRQGPHLICSGHVHQQDGIVTASIQGTGDVEFTAGAGHEDAGQAGNHGYAWIQLAANGIRFYPRTWVRDRQEFVAERNKFPSLGSDEALLLEPARLPDPLRVWLSRADTGGFRAASSFIVGRRQERDVLLRALDEGLAVQLLGLEGMGKSSLLRWLAREAPVLRGKVAFVSARELTGSSPLALVRAAGKALGRERDVEDALGGEPGAPGAAARALRKLAPLCLLVDDADALAKVEHGFDPGFFNVARELTQGRKLTWISASERDLQSLFDESGLNSAFLNDARRVPVGALSREDAEDLSRKAGVSPEHVAWCWELAGGFAPALGWLADRIVRGPIDLPGSERVLRRRLRPRFEAWWRALTTDERMMLKRCVGDGLLVDEQEDSARRQARALVDRGVLAEEGSRFRLRGRAWHDFVRDGD